MSESRSARKGGAPLMLPAERISARLTAGGSQPKEAMTVGKEPANLSPTMSATRDESNPHQSTKIARLPVRKVEK